MNDIMGLLKNLRRPQLLIRAARLGQEDYNRSRDLKRVLKSATPPSPGKALMMLISAEAEIEDRRQNDEATYSIARHVDVLVAMMGEARILTIARRSQA
jgi:hypothetical protein